MQGADTSYLRKEFATLPRDFSQVRKGTLLDVLNALAAFKRKSTSLEPDAYRAALAILVQLSEKQDADISHPLLTSFADIAQRSDKERVALEDILHNCITCDEDGNIKRDEHGNVILTDARLRTLTVPRIPATKK